MVIQCRKQINDAVQSKSRKIGILLKIFCDEIKDEVVFYANGEIEMSGPTHQDKLMQGNRLG